MNLNDIQKLVFKKNKYVKREYKIDNFLLHFPRIKTVRLNNVIENNMIELGLFKIRTCRLIDKVNISN